MSAAPRPRIGSVRFLSFITTPFSFVVCSHGWCPLQFLVARGCISTQASREFHDFQHGQRDRRDDEEHQTVRDVHHRGFQKTAHDLIVMAPNLKAKGEGYDEEEVDVGKQRNAPNTFGLATATKGAEEFSEHQHGKGVGAGECFRLSLQPVEVNCERHSSREESGEEHCAEEATVGDALRPATRATLHYVRVDGVGSEAQRGQAVCDQVNPEQVNWK